VVYIPAWSTRPQTTLTPYFKFEAKSFKSKVLRAKHRRSLQLLCTVGGNQAKLDARSEFNFRQRGG